MFSRKSRSSCLQICSIIASKRSSAQYRSQGFVLHSKGGRAQELLRHRRLGSLLLHAREFPTAWQRFGKFLLKSMVRGQAHSRATISPARESSSWLSANVKSNSPAALSNTLAVCCNAELKLASLQCCRLSHFCFTYDTLERQSNYNHDILPCPFRAESLIAQPRATP